MDSKCSATEEIKTAHTISVGHPERRIPLEMPRRRSEETVERQS